jgi:hypothetical protein
MNVIWYGLTIFQMHQKKLTFQMKFYSPIIIRNYLLNGILSNIGKVKLQKRIIQKNEKK